MFARIIANRTAYYGQVVTELATSGSPEKVAGKIAAHIDTYVADEKVCAAALLLPGLETLEDLARVLLALEAQPKWSVSKSVLQPPPDDEMIAVHITREIPFGNSVCPSEALVFGPFPTFPATRRAPTPALEIFVGEPRKYDPKDNVTPTTRANLAHIDMKFDDKFPNAFPKTWDNTVDGRKKSLGNDGKDNRAKAKVSFVMPMALAKQLGVAP